MSSKRIRHYAVGFLLQYLVDSGIENTPDVAFIMVAGRVEIIKALV